ncbi:MAG TPA: UDP-N-acetylmuramoyl-tripeptide--D-alanyl-D-alanine ligase [Candidatus Dojkabacteria bacterium]|nr:UDP-N-acetylmuramoyl-tripeptide--D-alanyl-D-alanine ligase [Candidatus Dojkabacteria bacterium]HQF37247.1 UDP-N-acetylmuramoyl-tripeptide--D-alanyl-D-alanine ligase [Candidatus Dojkabacteria bacterium]
MSIIKLTFFYNFLYIFQSEGYVIKRLLNNVIKNPFPIKVEKVKTLQWTHKAKWICISSLIIFLLPLILLILLKAPLLIILIYISIFIFLPWIFLILGIFTIFPLEKYNKSKVIKISQDKINKLKANKLKVIGITGSYGKTSTKSFTNQLLAYKYKSYATPKSYNTLWGIAQPVQKKAIFNTVQDTLQYLENDTEYFLVEMGAYFYGEITTLCTAFPPDIAILTGISSVHLERFKSIENIIKAKSELLHGLKANGTAIINADNRYARKIILNPPRKDIKIISYGTWKDSTYRLEISQMTKDGTDFIIHHDNSMNKMHTPIIGVGNIVNLTGAIATAHSQAVTWEDISKAVITLSPAESRMEITDNGTGLLLINNGYSSNVPSFKQSLETLSLFDSTYKILVTPGIFELGEKTYEIHKKLGKKITDNINLVILVKNKKTNDQIRGLKDGMAEGNYPENQIVEVDRIEQFYEQVSQRGLLPSVVLFENDVPDVYNV